ncbi:TonB-dependent receptor plug domain-containing protein [bacterium]
MKAKHFIFFFTYCFAIIVFSNAQSPADLGSLTVTGSRDLFIEFDKSQKTYIISRQDIENISADSLEDIFNTVPFITIDARGVNDVQSDIRFRGSSFEQVLIYLNGIPMNNRQTGHHNLDIPVSVKDIERIEIVPNAGSFIYGAGAYAGVIHIFTKDFEKREASVRLGSYGYYSLDLGVPFEYKSLQNSITLSKKKSSGYRQDTDFDTNRLWLHSIVPVKSHDINIYAGFLNKDFGANGFYGPALSRENIDSYSINDNYTFLYELHFRRYDDFFAYDLSKPQYDNDHTTDSCGSDIKLITEYDTARAVLGFAFRSDKIDSTNLGSHIDDSIGLYAMVSKDLDFGSYTLGFRGDTYSNYKNRLSPYLGFGMPFKDNWNLRASFGAGHRLPSFTEKYYSSPSNQGNENLEPEKTNNFELGALFSENDLKWDTALFLRDEHNVIDWGKTSSVQTAFSANNLSDLTASGIETSVSKKIYKDMSGTLSYTYTDLNTDVDHGYISKYTLNYIQSSVMLKIFTPLIYNINSFIQFDYKKRLNYDDYSLVNLTFKIANGKIYIKIDNIFDEEYKEVNNIPMPGTWIYAGCERTF